MQRSFQELKLPTPKHLPSMQIDSGLSDAGKWYNAALNTCAAMLGLEGKRK